MPDDDCPHAAELVLQRFLPYRLSVLSNRLSQDIARLYQARHGISVTQWRVLAVLARHPGISARELARRTAMDKVAISRAVAALVQSGHVVRGTDGHDHRRSVLRLSARGRSVHRAVAPRALAYEARLLDGMGAAERESLFRLLDRLDELEAGASDDAG